MRKILGLFHNSEYICLVGSPDPADIDESVCFLLDWKSGKFLKAEDSKHPSSGMRILVYSTPISIRVWSTAYSAQGLSRAPNQISIGSTLFYCKCQIGRGAWSLWLTMDNAAFQKKLLQWLKETDSLPNAIWTLTESQEPETFVITVYIK
jgi:hypothetical protein